MNNNVKDQVQAQIEATLAHSSQAQLARQIGVSDATIINIRRGNWDLISDAMLGKIRAYFRLDGWQVRNTHNFVVITKLCDDARTNKRMLAVAGYTGAGKTTALRHYATSNAEAYYMLATVVHTKRTFLESVARCMGIVAPMGMSDMLIAICDKLNTGSAPILIIDDAGKLSHSCLRLIQVIYDQTEHSAGIVLAGTEFLKEEIERASRRNALGFRELRRRIAYWQPLRRPTQQIIAAIAKDFAIEQPDAVEYIWRNAKDYGTIRNLILNADAIRARDGVAITRELLAGLHVGDMAYETEKAA
jgi:DNA transposition AAA+ family ATPase